uniref:AlNc14C242G9502 protein n=1 Tax=Albugo laibachii Nc14 TaxID=890382 RepID=F0WT16_9STRA|nr:AlNc14C242G9502 [Albugo laibachii Nc14]|eukprot:CCA24501.1 AlNc14C242G9502 [Albugo laibachii Nc14]
MNSLTVREAADQLKKSGEIYKIFGLNCIGEISVCNRDQFLAGMKVTRETEIHSSYKLSIFSPSQYICRLVL